MGNYEEGFKETGLQFACCSEVERAVCLDISEQ